MVRLEVVVAEHMTLQTGGALCFANRLHFCANKTKNQMEIEIGKLRWLGQLPTYKNSFFSLGTQTAQGLS